MQASFPQDVRLQNQRLRKQRGEKGKRGKEGDILQPEFGWKPASGAFHAGLTLLSDRELRHPCTSPHYPHSVLPVRPYSETNLTRSGLFTQIFVPQNRAVKTINLTQAWGHGLASSWRSESSAFAAGTNQGMRQSMGCGHPWYLAIWGPPLLSAGCGGKGDFFPELGEAPYGRDQRCCWVHGSALFPSTAVN